MIKKLEYIGIAIFVVLLVVILLKFVGKSDKNVQEEARPIDYVEAYFNEMQKGNFKKVNWFYDEVNEDNYNALMKEEYFYKVHWALYGVLLESEKIDNDKATVKVTINKKKHTDAMLNVKRRLLELVDNTEITESDLQDYKKAYILEELMSNDLEIITKTYNINLIKNENGEWKIVNDNVIKDILFGSTK